jgi:uncharacterized protein (TIGR02117 family)
MEGSKRRRYKRKSKPKKMTLGLLLTRAGIGTVLLLLVALLGYFGMALLGILFPSNKESIAVKEGIDVFVVSNGFHTDLVVPTRNKATAIDWFAYINDSTFTKPYQDHQYVAFGWGDDGFFMESYDDQLPSFPTIVTALFVPSPTLMHVTFYPTPLQPSENVALMKLTNEQYKSLVYFIEASFKKDLDSRFILKNAKGYGKDDYFFHAKGSYHLFNTCNDWTNTAIKWTGNKTASKAPFAASVMYYRK